MARLVHHMPARRTFTNVALFRAAVPATKALAASVEASGHFCSARKIGRRRCFPARTSFSFGSRTTSTVPSATNLLASVLAAAERPAARLPTRPGWGRALDHLCLFPARACLFTLLRTRVAGALMARATTSVHPTGQQFAASCPTRPRSITATFHGGRTPTMASCVFDDVRAWRTCTRVAKHHARVSALCLQQFVAKFSARVRRDPWIKLRINFLRTETSVLCRERVFIILRSALGTMPRTLLIWEQFIRQDGLFDTITNPMLDATHMIHFVASAAIPYWFRMPNIFKANQTCIRTRSAKLLQQLRMLRR